MNEISEDLSLGGVRIIRTNAAKTRLRHLKRIVLLIHRVGKSATVTIKEGDETLVVEKGKRTVQVNTGDETHEVKGKQDLTITDNETHTSKANASHSVESNRILTVKGSLVKIN